jgi:hypothetical protein
MADFNYRANLSAAALPVDPLTLGRTVIIKGYDNNYAPNIAAKEDKDKDIGIPQVYYCANALPTEQGFKSAAYHISQETCPGTPYTAFPVRSTIDSALLVHTKEGFLYRLVDDSPQFKYVGTQNGYVTYATVSGTTYLFFAGIGCFTYDFLTDTLVPVDLNGLTVAAIDGITGTAGYLMAWSADAIAWSSLFDPTDFVPSLDTGAGGGSVEGARGAISFLVPNPQGVFVFTESNCVAATLSNNAAFPFNFKEIVGSSGITDIQAISFDGNQSAAYAYTVNGFQEIKLNAAKPIWPDLSDNSKVTPVWDENTVITAGVEGSERGTEGAKITVVGSRYVCISIQNGTYTSNGQQYPAYRDCWIFDIALQRWGRLVKEHVEVFESENQEITLITLDNKIARVKDTNTADRFYNVESDVGVIVLGKYQYSRQRLTQLQQIELDNLYPTRVVDPLTGVLLQVKTPDVYVMTSLDGFGGSFVPAYKHSANKYLHRATGINHSIMIKGNFYLNSVVLTVNNHGGR